MYENKKILIAGLGKSGTAVLSALSGSGAELSIYDSRDIEWDEPGLYKSIIDRRISAYLNGVEPPDIDWDMIIKSPGVPPDLPFIRRATDKGIRLTGDIELAYEMDAGDFIAITGTNGKTTTTTLVGEIIRRAGLPGIITGNIGIPVMESVVSALGMGERPVFVTEISSFQLDTISDFRPKISAILNITPDHLDRHSTMEDYATVKARIFKNQGEDDILVYNTDDPLVNQLVSGSKAWQFPFSAAKALTNGTYAENGMIKIRDEKTGICEEIIKCSELRIPGRHNLENALAAVAISHAYGIQADVIAESLRRFSGVEHRMELITIIDGVKYINDSKGTNPDASSKAIEASEPGIFLIAGGFEKFADFKPFIGGFGDKVKSLLLIGETKQRFADEAKTVGFNKIRICDDLDMCIRICREHAEPGDTVLLSPASASWDMYKDFEERGNHFRRLVTDMERHGSSY